ncbi:hypothetical protein [Clostridium sp.]
MIVGLEFVDEGKKGRMSRKYSVLEADIRYKGATSVASSLSST